MSTDNPSAYSSKDGAYALYLVFCLFFVVGRSLTIDTEEGADWEIAFSMVFGTFGFVVLPVAAVFASLSDKPRERGLIVLAVATVVLYSPTFLSLLLLLAPSLLENLSWLTRFLWIAYAYFYFGCICVLVVRWMFVRRRYGREGPSL